MAIETKLSDELSLLLGIAAGVAARDGRATSDFPSVRALLEGLTKLPPASSDQLAVFDQFTHTRRGSSYIVIIGKGTLQTDKPLDDNTVLVTYVGEDGQVWHRTSDEFLDGRFTKLP